jgi:cytochrome c
MSSCYYIVKTASSSLSWLFLCLSLIGLVPISASAFDRYTAHGGPVRDLALSPDGKHFVTASFDYSAVLWSADEIAEKSTLIGHEAALNTAQFSPDGKWLATGGDDGLVLVWKADQLNDEFG